MQSLAYQRGFIDFCNLHGIEKRASLFLMKEAATTSTLSLFGDVLRGVGSGATLGWRLGKGVMSVPKWVMSVPKWMTQGATRIPYLNKIPEIPGHALRLWGGLTARHPFIGALALGVPLAGGAALLGQHNGITTNSFLDVPTLTPVEKNIFDHVKLYPGASSALGDMRGIIR